MAKKHMENFNKKKDSHIEIKKIENGCKATGKNIEQTFSCDACEHKDKWNCIALKETIPDKK